MDGREKDKGVGQQKIKQRQEAENDHALTISMLRCVPALLIGVGVLSLSLSLSLFRYS